MVKFIKANGLGNDFVIIDGRETPIILEKETVIKLADRKKGVGCDQVIYLKDSPKADVYMQIFNPDGSEAEACGNATRCVGYLLEKDLGLIETKVGLLRSHKKEGGDVEVSLGESSILHENIELDGVIRAMAVSVGNPHLVCFVESLEKFPVDRRGKELEYHPFFPNKTNVEFVQILGKGHLKAYVWERGAGRTLACGTGAAAAAKAYQEITQEEVDVTVDLQGGSLKVSFISKVQAVITGPVEINYYGQFDLSA